MVRHRWDEKGWIIILHVFGTIIRSCRGNRPGTFGHATRGAGKTGGRHKRRASEKLLSNWLEETLIEKINLCPPNRRCVCLYIYLCFRNAASGWHPVLSAPGPLCLTQRYINWASRPLVPLSTQDYLFHPGVLVTLYI